MYTLHTTLPAIIILYISRTVLIARKILMQEIVLVLILTCWMSIGDTDVSSWHEINALSLLLLLLLFDNVMGRK